MRTRPGTWPGPCSSTSTGGSPRPPHPWTAVIHSPGPTSSPTAWACGHLQRRDRGRLRRRRRATAARLVWLLRACGERAALLDRGLAADDEPLSVVAPVVVPGSFGLDAWPDIVTADADEVADAVASGGVVIDARAAQRYDGTTEPIDPRAGHIPGAVNVPFVGNLDAGGRFLDPPTLRARYTAVGADATPTVVYCGSGVTACHDLLAIEHAGLPPARLYPGSWSQWSADPARPVATSLR